MKKSNKRAFTLIELLVSVLIIGILAAVAVPQYQKAVKKARGAEVLAILDALDQAIPNYYLEHGTYDDLSNDTLNVNIPDLTSFQFGCSYFNTLGNSFRGCDNTAHPSDSCDVHISNDDIDVELSWHNSRPIPEYHRSCTPYNKCMEYFNCDTITHIRDTGSSVYTWSECFLK